MRSCNPEITPMETNIKLRNELEDEIAYGILYKEIIDSLRYLCNTRPGIYHSVRLVSKSLEQPK